VGIAGLDRRVAGQDLPAAADLDLRAEVGPGLPLGSWIPAVVQASRADASQNPRTAAKDVNVGWG